jgi:hypothetical protein
MTEQIKTWLVLFGGLLVGFLLVVLLIAVVPSSLLSKATFGPEVKLPLLAIIGVISLLASLTFVSVAFSMLNLSDKAQALALPEGSVRAVIALSLIVIFAITSVFLYGNLADRGVQKVASLTTEQKEMFEKSSLKSDIFLIEPTGTGPDTRYTIYYNAPGSQASADFAKQVFAMLGTLVTAVASFYFGTRAAAAAAAAATNQTLTPTITSVKPTSGTKGSTVNLEIVGSNLQLAKEVKLVQGSKEVLASDITSNVSLIKCTVILDAALESGAWDVMVINSDGGTTKLPAAFTVS